MISRSDIEGLQQRPVKSGSPVLSVNLDTDKLEVSVVGQFRLGCPTNFSLSWRQRQAKA